MNLPDTEFYTEEPPQLPPARRRRARRLLAPMDADERAAFLDQLAHRASPSFDFFLFSLLAGLVICLGLLLDSPSLLLLGALFAPGMMPVIGVALGTVTGSVKFFLRSLIGLTIGVLLAFSAGILVGYLAGSRPPEGLEQAYHFAQLSWINLIVLAIGAVMTTVYLAHSERHPALPSVALAYELYIPLIVSGYGLASGQTHLWPDGLVVFAFHLTLAIILGALTLAILGFRPLSFLGYTLGGVLALIGIVVLIWLSLMGTVAGTRIALPTLTPTATITPTEAIPPTATITPTPVPPTFTPTPSVTATRTPTLTITVTPTPTPMYARIQAGENGGANLREEPGYDGKIIRPYNNGTLVQVLSETEEIGGILWMRVRVVSDGTEGWMLLSLLSMATPAPNW